MKRISILILYITAVLICNVSNADTRIIGIHTPGLIQNDHKGKYDLTLSKANIKLDILPVARAFLEFEECSDCCITPANKNSDFYNYTSTEYIESLPMSIARIYIFSPPKKPVVTDIQQLIGKKVGGRIGLSYGKLVDSTLKNIDRVADLEFNIKKLQSGRLEYMVEYNPDTLHEMKRLGVNLPYDSNRPVAIHKDAVLCKSSSENKKLIEKINKTIK